MILHDIADTDSLFIVAKGDFIAPCDYEMFKKIWFFLDNLGIEIKIILSHSIFIYFMKQIAHSGNSIEFLSRIKIDIVFRC
jgi:hypothetical protein